MSRVIQRGAKRTRRGDKNEPATDRQRAALAAALLRKAADELLNAAALIGPRSTPKVRRTR
jgi:hypothetical protein